MPNPLEEQIVSLMKRGDKSFIGLIYDNYADNLFGVVKTILRDEDAAQDVIQDSFIKIWKNAKKYDPEKAKLFTWLLRICRNTAIDKFRSTQKHSFREIQIDDSNVSEVGIEPIKPQLMDIKEHLAGLDVKYQEVIGALYFGGMTQAEASEALGLPLGTVKTRLKIGLRELRKVFGDKELLILLILILS